MAGSDNDNGNMSPNNNEGGDSSMNPNTDVCGVANTVLAYIQYGISSATPDNIVEVACSHFTLDEITYAKNKLWKVCTLGSPPPRNNSKGRKALEAHMHDIIDSMFKVDKKDYVFYVEAAEIGRLPRFNAECLNVVSIDQRIAALKEECFALKLESSSYRNEMLKYHNQMNFMQTVLQQHTDALRELRNTDGSYGMRTHHITPHEQPSRSHTTSGNVPVQCTPSTRQATPSAHMASPPLATEAVKNANLPKRTSLCATSRLVAPPQLTAQLSVSSPPNSSKESVMCHSFPHSMTTSNTNNCGGIKNNMFTNAAQSYSGVAKIGDRPIPPAFSSQSSPEIMRSNASDHHSRQSNAHYNNTRDRHVDGEGFMRNKWDIERDRQRDRQRERYRNKVVYGSKSTPDPRISDEMKDSNCDVFVFNVPFRAKISGMRGYLSDNGINTSDIRIDITSHESAEHKSFRIIAPAEFRDKLLTSEFWPVDVRVKEYDVKQKRRSNFRRNYMPTRHYNNNYAY